MCEYVQLVEARKKISGGKVEYIWDFGSLSLGVKNLSFLCTRNPWQREDQLFDPQQNTNSLSSPVTNDFPCSQIMRVKVSCFALSICIRHSAAYFNSSVMLLLFIRTKRILTQFKLSRRCSPSCHCGNSFNSLCPHHGTAPNVWLQFMNSCTSVRTVSTLLCLGLPSSIYGHLCLLRVRPFAESILIVERPFREYGGYFDWLQFSYLEECR